MDNGKGDDFVTGLLRVRYLFEATGPRREVSLCWERIGSGNECSEIRGESHGLLVLCRELKRIGNPHNLMV